MDDHATNLLVRSLTMAKQEYKQGDIKGLIRFFIEIYRLDQNEVLKSVMGQFPALSDASKCPNCHASMKIDLYTPDILDAVLLLEMAREVKLRMSKGMSFTDANFVHVPTLRTTDAIRHRTTRCSYLNYIKQPELSRNTGNWLITTWGWKALRGEPVPRSVKYFRGTLIERGTDTITLSEMFKTHTDRVREAIERRKTPKSDHVHLIKDYSPSEWVELGGYVEGDLI